MEWTGDVSTGDWIRQRLDDGLSPSMHGVVPRGFPAYVRVFHPATRSRPVGQDWPPLPLERHRAAWDALADVEIDTVPARWADAAASFGTTMHPLAQWHALVTRPGDDPNEWQQTHSPDGWQYHAPLEGGLDAGALTAVASRLASHTTTPDDGNVALWEGWGGLLGFVGEAPSRAFFGWGGPPAVEGSPHTEVLGRSVHDRFNNPYRKSTWQPGILSDDISRGPRLELPARSHVLFRGGVSELADPDWELHVPWRDRPAEEHGFAPSAHSPSLIWPVDRAWVLVTEVDFDSTIVAGSPELVAAIVTDPRLEAAAIPADADLTWEGDRINR